MSTFRTYTNYILDLCEATYNGNIGFAELIAFQRKATDDQKKEFNDHLNNNRQREAWGVVQNALNTKLHSSVYSKEHENVS